MKKSIQKLLAVVIALYMIFALIPQISVVAAQPTSYSKSSNSGTRDEVCTTLDGTSADSYYTGSYTYDKLDDLSGSTLEATLRTLMRSTHTHTSSYDNCRDMADQTDCEGNDGRVSLIYTSYSATMSQYNGWNREHVWPKSLGGNTTSGGGADLHHIRPSDAGVNSSRGNKKYGESGSNPTSKYGTNPAVGVLGGTYNSTYFEPLDNVKGDVARICLYVYVRWNSDWGATSITKVFQSVDILLEWCELDPVDTWEMGRNEVVQSIQGNRNVFIDYPELAWLLFDREIPDDLVSPTSGNEGGNTGGGNTGGDNTGGDTPGGDTTPTVTPIASIFSGDSKEYTAEGTVVATNARSYLLADDTGAILVYLGSSPSVKIGDKLRITGTTSSYGGAMQFGSDTTYTKIGTEQVKYPTPKQLNGAACDAYANAVKTDYVKVVGTLSTSGSGNKTYYNLDIEGATLTGSITYPANTSALSAYIGKEVEVTGYVTGITGSDTKYLNLIMTDICEYSASTACKHTSTKTVGAVGATCGADGYTGDTHCASCNEKLASGSVLPATGNHAWGPWEQNDSVSEIRTCSTCKKAETRGLDGECLHNNTQTVGAKEPTCTEEGRTGQTKCTDCGAELSANEVIPMTEHVWGESVTVYPATEKQAGRAKKVCTSCQKVVFEEIPQLKSNGGCAGGDTKATFTPVLMGGSLAVLFVGFRRRKNKK